MTTTLSLRPHANLHLLDSSGPAARGVRPVHVVGPDTETPAFGVPGPRTWVVYAGGPGDVAVTYSVPDAELRSGALDSPLVVALGEAQRDVATFRFEDVRDGSENDAVLGAELAEGGYRLIITDLADALDTLDNALDIVATWTGQAARREQRATASLRATIARLAVARAAIR